MKTVILAVVLSALACCTPPLGPSPMPPDATDASPDVPDAAPVVKDADPVDSATQDAPSDPATRACQHLEDLGCPLGTKPTCRAVFELDPKWGISPACVLSAKTPADLASCHVTCR